MLTFVVYYRIHLNLNLEASARQWPNNLSHPFWENPTLKPRALVRFLSSWIRICFMNMNNCLPKAGTSIQGLFQAVLHFQLITLTLKAHWTFLSIYTPKRLIHSGANGFKPDNVPLSLRDTGYCHSDHKVSPPVHKVTLSNATIYSVGSLVSGYGKDRFMFTNLDWTLRGDRNSTSSTVLSRFRVNFPFSPNHCHLTPCSSLNIYIQLQYICV